MLKTKKSKLLATMLCATVVAGLYAGPVMADDLTVKIEEGHIVAKEDTWFGPEYHPVTGSFTISGSDIANALNNQNLNVGNVTSDNIFSKNYDLESIGKNTSKISIVGGGIGTWTNVSSNMNVQGDFKVSGNTTMSGTLVAKEVALTNGITLTNLNSNVTTNINNIKQLQENVKSIDGDLNAVGEALDKLDSTVGQTNKNVAGIEREKVQTINGTGYATVIEGSTVIGSDGSFSTANGKFTIEKDGRVSVAESIHVAKGGQIGAAEFDQNGMVIESQNGTTAIFGGQATYSNQNGSTNINGGQIVTEDVQLETINGVNFSDFVQSGEIKNVAGIKREGNEVSGYTTTIEGTTKFDENGMTTGTINAANGSFQVEEGNGKTVVAGSMIYSKNQNGSYGILDGNQLSLQGTDGSKVSIINGNIETSGNILANGSMTAEDFITKDGVKLSEVNDSLKNLGEAVDKTNANVAGITREEINGDYVTTIEGAIRISESGYISLNGDNLNFTYQTKDGIGIGNLGALANKVTEIDNRLDVVEDKTQNINSDATHGGNGQTGEGGAVVDNGANTGFDGDVTVGGDVNANGGSFTGDVQVGGSLTVGGENGTAIDSNGMTVGDTSVDKDGVTVGGENGTSITKDDVVINKGTDNEVSLSDVGGRVDNLEQGLASANNRIDHLEDRIDKVGAMSAAIANLRTMGYDPTAPTEIAVGIGQYRSETGAALGLFHYPNKDFMLSLSVSTSGDEVMGGIGATWKFGRKTPEQMLEHEKEKAAKAKLAKAEAMKKAAAEAKVAAQQAKHAQMAAERAAK